MILSATLVSKADIHFDTCYAAALIVVVGAYSISALDCINQNAGDVPLNSLPGNNDLSIYLAFI